MNTLEISLIICAPFAIGAFIAGWIAFIWGLGFCVSVVLDRIGIKAPFENKPMLKLGGFIGLPVFILVYLIIYLINSNV